jgi:hypothetical protein
MPDDVPRRGEPMKWLFAGAALAVVGAALLFGGTPWTTGSGYGVVWIAAVALLCIDAMFAALWSLTL